MNFIAANVKMLVFLDVNNDSARDGIGLLTCGQYDALVILAERRRNVGNLFVANFDFVGLFPVFSAVENADRAGILVGHQQLIAAGEHGFGLFGVEHLQNLAGG